MPRFVILEHNHLELHWDFMLECGTVLLTWRFAAAPGPAEAISATRSFDHRLIYLDYEGPLTGGRGQVLRWDRGTFTWQLQAPDRVEVQLNGDRLRGLLRLVQQEGLLWCGQFLADIGGSGSADLVNQPTT